MPEKKPYRELTPASIAGGILVGALLNTGICYAGLKIGFTIVGSTVAAVLGFGILRVILRRGSILEVNIFQSVASTVNIVNAGIIFTVPVLFLLEKESEIHYLSLILATIGGAILGNVLIVPLRKQIIEFERLRFPEGVAVAAILKAPGAGVEKAKLLVAGFIISAAVAGLTLVPLKADRDASGQVARDAEGEVRRVPLLPEVFNAGEALGSPAGVRLVFALSLLTLGSGYLAGRPGLVVLYGTLLNFWVLIPVCVLLGWVPEHYKEYTPFAWGTPDFSDHVRADGFAADFSPFTSRRVGIGMILGGAVAGIAIALPAVKAALTSLRSPSLGGRREEVSFKVLGAGLALGLVLLFLGAKLSGGAHVGALQAALVTVVGGLWLWLAGLVVAQTTGRTDWSPLSGLALIAIAILMGILGTGEPFVVPAVTVGAAICVATSMCADMMADLKTGYLVGSRPASQQIAQIATCWIGPPIALGTVIILWQAYAFGPRQAEVLHQRAVAAGPEAVREYEAAGGTREKLPRGMPALGAPQAAALESAIEIIQSGKLPLGKYLAGAVLGLAVSLLVSPGIGVMVGLSLYLPFEYMIVFGIGGVLSILVSRWKGARFAEDKGVPLAAGLIVGEALVGVANAFYKVMSSF